MDEETKVKLRRYRKNIELNGKAMLLVGCWTVLKYFMIICFGDKTIMDLMRVTEEELEEYGAFLTVTFFLIMGIIVLMYVYLGRRAIRYASGKSKRLFFLVFAALFFILTVLGLPGYFIEIKEDLTQIDTILAALFVDITTCFALGDMIYAAIQIKRLSKGTVLSEV
ncbi:hypothetical protein [Oribacterium sp. FC2011]|uniref:hypothetical protein n=1 Tax=Oribacterium sp. FC2011 TaxID=1408311 RepID=UPI0004E26483|nr:hypothetical protein [Oribacterium sp. FC2011]